MQLINVDPEQLISVREAADILEISPRAVTKKIKQGKLPALKVGTQWILQRGACAFHKRASEYKKLAQKKKL